MAAKTHSNLDNTQRPSTDTMPMLNTSIEEYRLHDLGPGIPVLQPLPGGTYREYRPGGKMRMVEGWLETVPNEIGDGIVGLTNYPPLLHGLATYPA